MENCLNPSLHIVLKTTKAIIWHSMLHGSLRSRVFWHRNIWWNSSGVTTAYSCAAVKKEDFNWHGASRGLSTAVQHLSTGSAQVLHCYR